MHYHKIKMTAAAMAMAVLVTGNMPAKYSDGIRKVCDISSPAGSRRWSGIK
jgi:hypothetical protein